MPQRLYALGDDFMSLFETFRYTAFRLETLQAYTVDYEQDTLRSFLAGEDPPEDEGKQEWCRIILLAASNARRMSRVHIVAEPLSDYLRYELGWSYRPNVRAGEHIRIAPASMIPDGELPERHDFWLFDSRDLWVMAYDDVGRFLYAEHVTDPAEIVRHNTIRDAAMRWSFDYRSYMRQHPDLA